MSYTFDEEKTREAFAFATTEDMAIGHVTLYGVVCIGPEGEDISYSHGGQLTLDPIHAIEAAKEANAQWSGEDACRYIPVAVGLDPQAVFRLANLLIGADVPEEEVE